MEPPSTHLITAPTTRCFCAMLRFLSNSLLSLFLASTDLIFIDQRHFLKKHIVALSLTLFQTGNYRSGDLIHYLFEFYTTGTSYTLGNNHFAFECQRPFWNASVSATFSSVIAFVLKHLAKYKCLCVLTGTFSRKERTPLVSSGVGGHIYWNKPQNISQCVVNEGLTRSVVLCMIIIKFSPHLPSLFCVLGAHCFIQRCLRAPDIRLCVCINKMALPCFWPWRMV